jgi:hypothetical protein
MVTTMGVFFCLVESKFCDKKSGTEYGDVVLRMGLQNYERLK